MKALTISDTLSIDSIFWRKNQNAYSQVSGICCFCKALEDGRSVDLVELERLQEQLKSQVTEYEQLCAELKALQQEKTVCLYNIIMNTGVDSSV
jgi:DNA polymerase III gamma/tau subunit